MAARQGKGDVEILAVVIAPVHGVGQQVDQVRLQFIGAVLCNRLVGSLGTLFVGRHSRIPFLVKLKNGAGVHARPGRSSYSFSSEATRRVMRPSSGMQSSWTLN